VLISPKGESMKFLLVLLLVLTSCASKDKRIEAMEIVDGASWAKFECKYPNNDIICDIVGKDKYATDQEFKEDVARISDYMWGVEQGLKKEGWNGKILIKREEKIIFKLLHPRGA